MRTQRYLNILSFPVAFEFKNGALGARRRVKVGRLEGHIVLPRANNAAIGGAFAELLPPALKHMDFAARVYAQSHRHEFDSRLRWGGYFTYHPTDPVNTAVASVGAAVLAFSNRQSGEELTVHQVGEECLEHFPRWCARLRDWIEVLTRDDLNAAFPVSAAVVPERWTSTAWIRFKDNDGLDRDFINPMLHLFGSDGKNAMDASTWAKAVEAANDCREIPEVWALLRDARAAQIRNQGRRAVLDAATAVELIVNRQLRDRLLEMNPANYVEKAMKGTWQVTRRLDLMVGLGMWVPTGIDAKLTALRNRVVHANDPVTRDQAKQAVDVTEELVRHYAATLLG